MPPIPVLLATHLLDTGGSERQVRQLSVALDRSMYDVHLAFFRPDDARERELQDSGVKTIHVPLYSYTSISTVQSALLLRRYLNKHRIQLVHGFDNPSSTFAVPVARLSGTPIALASQRSHRYLESKGLHRLRRMVDPFAHGFVVNADALVAHLRDDEGIDASKIYFCPNGLDTKRFFPEGRKRLPQFENASLVIGCVATHRKEKQLPFLITAFAEMRRMRPGLKLLLVGSGPDTESVVQSVQRNQLGDDCVMIPHTPDTPELLKSMDIFVLASSSEGASNSVMEAMASGCAVVASNVKGTRDLVKDGENGFLFEFGNEADLIAKVMALIDHPALRLKTAAASSEWVRRTMSVEASVKRMSEIYEGYLSRKGIL